MIEKDYKSIVDTLSKMTARGLGNWVDNLSIVLWADRSTVRRSIENFFSIFFAAESRSYLLSLIF